MDLKGDVGEITQMTVLAAIANWSVFAFALLLWPIQMVAHEAIGLAPGAERAEERLKPKV
jgi:hypothetical protein